MPQDIRFALRSLRKSPAITLAALLTLALGIGATTAIFTITRGILLTPLPFPEPNRLVMIWEVSPRHNDHNPISTANFLDWQAQSHVFKSMAVFAPYSMSLTGRGDPRQLDGFVATPRIFDVLGVQAALGRTFSQDAGLPGKPKVAVISHRLWQQLGGDPALVGQTIALGGESTTVIGVLPADFGALPAGLVPTRDADFFVPIQLTEEYHARHGRGGLAIARLADGVSLPQAQAEMGTIAARLAHEYADFDKGWGVNVAPLARDLVSSVRPALLVLLVAVGLVLLVACANVANLLLARATARRKELALRAALGAGRAHLIRQLLTESLVLSVIGGAAGLLVGAWLLRVLLAVASGSVPIPRLSHVHLDPWMAAFAIGLSMVTGLAFGLAPAASIWHLQAHDALKEGARGTSADRRRHHAFVVAEVAFALVLLMGAGLMLRSFWQLTHVDPGFRAGHVLTMKAVLPSGTYQSDTQRTTFFRDAVARLDALPGVQAASAVSYLPMGGLGSATKFFVNDRPQPPAGEWPTTDVRAVSPGYFRSMGIPMLRGRDFSAHDTADAPAVVIINQTLARTFWPGQNPLGRHLTYSWGTLIPVEVVGVVGDARLVTLSDDDIRPAIYCPQLQQPHNAMTFVIKTAGDPAGWASAARGAIHQIDPNQPLSDIEPLEAVLADSLARPRLVALLLAIFGGAALLLAAIGIYGVMMYIVTARTQEIGVRVALGASQARVLRLVVGQAMAMAGLGIAIGMAGALALTHLLGTLLYGVTPTDPLTFTAVALLLALVAAAASLLPARRAAAVDPMVAMRAE